MDGLEKLAEANKMPVFSEKVSQYWIFNVLFKKLIYANQYDK